MTDDELERSCKAIKDSFGKESWITALATECLRQRKEIQTLRAEITNAVAAEREACEADAAHAVWDAHEAEGKAVSKGCSPYSREFRTANIVERVCAAIRARGIELVIVESEKPFVNIVTGPK